MSFVRFLNCTQRFVNIYWIDYQGHAVSYGVLVPSEGIDMDTFVTHPWIFVDVNTLDRYVVNQKDVFFPEPPRTNVRVKIYITLPVYSLRELSLRVIRECLKHASHAFQLEIPSTLQHELAHMRSKIDNTEENQDSQNRRNS